MRESADSVRSLTMLRTDDSARAAADASREGGTLRYQPALDGVRAVSVIAVLLFHADVALFSGGYLGVSVFFTLSGFLITSLLVAEYDNSRIGDGPGRVRLTAFYARRARRLLPASVLCIVGVAVIARVTDWFDGVTTLRRDAVGGLLQVANWVFLSGDGSYQDLLQQQTGTVSPFEHFWSLAIEEQFYWLWPVAFFGLARVARNAVGRVRILTVITVAACLAAPLIAAVWGADAAYWSTPARIAEIFVGALLAVAIHGRTVSSRWAIAAPIALGALLVAMVTFPAAGGPAYSGALPLVALASGALLLGLQAEGPVRRHLSAGPLVWLGRISYGVYLYHWPIFIIVDADRVGVDGVGLFVIRIALTLLIAQLSSMLVEQPIRRAHWLAPRPTLIGVAAAVAAAVAIVFVVIPQSNFNYWTISREAADAAAIDEVDEPLAELVAAPTDEPVTEPPVTEPPVTVEPVLEAPVTSDQPSENGIDEVVADGAVEPAAIAQPDIPALARPVRIVVVGDSTAEATGVGVVAWAGLHPDSAQAEIDVAPGCGFVRGGQRFVFDEWQDVSSGCDQWLTTLPERVAEVQPDVVALMTGVWDIVDRRFDGGPGLSPTDGEMIERIDAEMADLTMRLLDGGAASVAWITPPLIENELTDGAARNQVLVDAMHALAKSVPDRVYVIDLRGYLSDTGLDAEPGIRPDGVHFTPDASLRIADEYLGEQLIRAALALDPR